MDGSYTWLRGVFITQRSVISQHRHLITTPLLSKRQESAEACQERDQYFLTPG